MHPKKIKLRVDPLYGFEPVIPPQAYMNGICMCKPTKDLCNLGGSIWPTTCDLKLQNGVNPMFKFKYFKITIIVHHFERMDMNG